ncbi:MAG: YkgJ family cysteine cluster protein [Acidobacteriota bacterium]
MPPEDSDPNWFAEGVRFRCHGADCGACCSGKMGPGAVWVNREEMERLAEHTGLPVYEFKSRYIRRLEGRYSLKEKPNYDCVFLEPGRGCSVYDARPGQCRTYPFWDRVMASRVTWQIEAESCPGIECDETRVEGEEVRRQLEIDRRRRE